jgi:hypothetical protein
MNATRNRNRTFVLVCSTVVSGGLGWENTFKKYWGRIFVRSFNGSVGMSLFVKNLKPGLIIIQRLPEQTLFPFL